MESPSRNDGSALVETSAQGFDLEDAEQLELFPELPKEEQSPKNLSVLEKGGTTARFVAEYFICNNAKEAYFKASGKCSEESARRRGSKLLTRVDVQAALAHLNGEIKVNALVSKLNIITSVLETREKALNPEFGRAQLGRANESNRLLAQMAGMINGDQVNVNNNTIVSLDEFRKLVGENEAQENAKKEDK